MWIFRALFGSDDEEDEEDELIEALLDDNPPKGTHGDMAEKLGLGSQPDVVDYYNALINVQGNPKVKAMSRDERVKTIAQAAAALDDLEERQKTGRW